MTRMLFVGAIALVGASPAFAADLPAPYAPPQAPAAYAPPPAFNWGGIYIGINGGGSWVSQGNTNFTCTGPGCLAATKTSSGQSFNNGGFGGGGQIGFNYQTGQVVFGLEADADYLSNKSSVTGTDFAGGNVTHAYSTDFLSTVRGRLGFAWDRALIYGTGGLAMADYQVQRTQNTAPFGGLAAAGTSQNVSNFRLGWAAGAGVEYAFTDSITGRVEYLVAGLESVNDAYNFTGATVTANSPTEYINMVRAGLNFKFNPY
ncbi:MAG: outer membrane protein [Xanthobacteraceae bacterium]